MRTAMVRSFALGMIAGSFLTAGLITAIPAKADGFVDDSEADYIFSYGADAICPVIDQYHSFAGVMGVAKAIVNDGFAEDSAVDIINASVELYCPRNWPLLVAIGKQARGQASA